MYKFQTSSVTNGTQLTRWSRNGMGRYLVSLVALLGTLLPSSGLLSAAEITVFGPETYYRQSGAPVTEVNTFSVTDPNGDFVLTVHNGGLEDETVLGEYVSSSIVKINDIVILGPENFNQNVDQIIVPVSLLQDNEISVELHGKPGGVLTVEIVGEGKPRRWRLRVPTKQFRSVPQYYWTAVVRPIWMVTC